jgi:hypothetical protein
VYREHYKDNMVTIEAATQPMSFLDATTVFRGINERQFRDLQAKGVITPRHSTGWTAETLTLFSPSTAINHVLEKMREHCVSFTLQVGTAVWYATSGGTLDGYVVVARLPKVVRAVIEGSDAPVAYSGDDATEWIDPRHLVFGAHQLAWSRFRSRAVVDQEVLLAGGSVVPAAIHRVAKYQANRRFAPWKVTGEQISVR